MNKKMTNISAWNDIVVVAAIDCADDDNNPICREYEIMHYPMLKYFSVNAHPPSLGLVIEKGDNTDSVRHNLISRLETEQQEGRGSTWPNITPYRYIINFPQLFPRLLIPTELQKKILFIAGTLK